MTTDPRRQALIDSITQRSPYEMSNTAICLVYGHVITEQLCCDRNLIKLNDFVVMCSREQVTMMKLSGVLEGCKVRSPTQVIECIDKICDDVPFFHDESSDQIIDPKETELFLNAFYNDPWLHIRVYIP